MKTSFFSAAFLIFFSTIILSGCGKEETPAPASVPTETAQSAEAAPSASGQGVIKGQVTFAGAAPAVSKLDMAADPACAALHPEGAFSEEVVVNSNQTLRDAFVYVKNPPAGNYPAPSLPAVLDQKGCQYTPHVLGVRVNQPLRILNSDATLHNVHGMPQKDKEFNLGMPVQGMKIDRKFTQPEIMVKFKCDVHPWMSAYVGVLEHPFFAVTGADGSFEIKGLPAGKYTLEVWQERFGTKTVEVDLPADGEALTSIAY